MAANLSDLIAMLSAISGREESLSLDVETNQDEDKEPTEKVAKLTKTVLADIVEHEGPLTIPKGMTAKQAIELIKRKDEEDNQITAFTEKFNVFPWDGANALRVVLERLAGFTIREGTDSFFGKEPPMEISVEVGPGMFVNIPWGIIKAPGLDGQIETGFEASGGQLTFNFTAKVKRKNEARVRELAQKMRAYLRNGGSIYQGRAIKMAFHDEGGDSYYDQGRLMEVRPTFLDLTGVTPDRLIFTEELDAKIKDYCYTHLLYPEACEALKVPGKRGLLFQGPPGVGKTEVARVAAKLATEKGLTVVYCNAAVDFPQAVSFALMYAPAVVFCEDIDQVAGGTKRDASINRILNIMDGIETKQQKIKFILTSNNVDAIQQPMLRPGRVDACIKFTPPDSKAVDGLIRLYAGSFLAEDANTTKAAFRLDGQIPAVIGEVVERAKLSAIRRAAGVVADVKLNGDDLALAAESIQEQLELLNRKMPAAESEFVKGSKITAAATEKLADSIKFSYNKPTPEVLAAAADNTTGARANKENA